MVMELKPVWKQVGTGDYLHYAQETARWLRTLEVRETDKSYWLSNAAGEGHIDLYHGSAGIILFFIQLAAATGDSTFLEDAKHGGNYILAQFTRRSWDAVTSALGGNHYKSGTRWTLYSGGWAGIGFALLELFKASGDEKYQNAAFVISEAIAVNAKEENGTLIWSGKAGINFDSGTILYLIYAARFFQRPDWLESAVRAGKGIQSTGEPVEKGIRYNGFANMTNIMFGDSRPDAHMPGFAYGTAGISYTLARLYQETGDSEFLEGAKAGAAYVAGVAHNEGNCALVPHRIPEWSNLFYLGHCHGVAGTGKLFYLLHDITGESFYADWHEKLIQGLLGTGAPEIHSPGYWHCFSWCCGTAGFLNLFTGTYLKKREERYLDYARRSGAVIISEANVDSSGVRWYQMFKRIVPDEVTVEPGYGSGAAGIATALIHLWLAEQGRAPILRFPDEPYPIETVVPV